MSDYHGKLYRVKEPTQEQKEQYRAFVQNEINTPCEVCGSTSWAAKTISGAFLEFTCHRTHVKLFKIAFPPERLDAPLLNPTDLERSYFEQFKGDAEDEVEWQETVDPPCFWVCIKTPDGESHIAPFMIEDGDVRVADDNTVMSAHLFREMLTKKYGPATFTQEKENG
jgi:hypothetical protein